MFVKRLQTFSWLVELVKFEMFKKNSTHIVKAMFTKYLMNWKYFSIFSSTIFFLYQTNIAFWDNSSKYHMDQRILAWGLVVQRTQYF